MVHSGSRNIGKKVCEYFNEIAEKQNKQWYSNSAIPFLPVISSWGKDYISLMNLCVRFSFLNRQAMIEDVFKNIKHYFPNADIITKTIEGNKDDIINISHNYASQETISGNTYWVHRKGAVLARKGIIGIIPGSQSTNSFITVGLGNAESLESCSHGSGRKMGRKEFNVQNQAKLHEIEDDMKNKGIVFSKFKIAESRKGRDTGMYDLSEASGAYKDVISVMSHQEDLVKPLVKLYPLINWKG
jgi:tRNA-splicing ligase RtcB (3'-phosphate/5'-hydroxy nucleic acid ligase)